MKYFIVNYLLLQSFSSALSAQIVTDATLGGTGQALQGPSYAIGAELGYLAGGNLLHSFSTFNLDNGETAVFSGTGPIDNVIARVTGGQASFIDGTLRTDFADTAPNLYFVNPAGILFGSNAALDVQGSFYASTADYLTLGDSGRIDAAQPNKSVLVAAAPKAFGFLGNTPGTIELHGTASDSPSMLSVKAGATLGLVGGAITLSNGRLVAPSGRIDLVSVATAGEVDISGSVPQVAASTASGTVQLGNNRSPAGQANAVFGLGDIDTSGTPGGTVHIRAGQLNLNNSYIFSHTVGNEDGGVIDIQAHSLNLDRKSHISTLTGFTTTDQFVNSGTGAAGSIHVTADHVVLANDSSLVNGTFSQGNGSEIRFDVDDLTLIDSIDPPIVSFTFSTGASGDIIIQATEKVTVQNNAAVISEGDIANNSFADGHAGNITIDTPTLNIDNGFIQSLAGSAGDAGNINIKTSRITIENGAQIDARVNIQGTGNAGDVLLTADNVVIRGRSANGRFPSGLFSNTQNPGAGGNAGLVSVTATTIQIENRAQIAVNSRGQGRAGEIRIQSNDLLLANNSQIVSASNSTDPANAGAAGNIFINVTDGLSLTGNSLISSESVQAGGGSISIDAGGRVDLLNSSINTAVLGAAGDSNAGDINIGNSLSPTFIIQQDSKIIASARQAGSGGNINLIAENFFATPASIIDATGGRGLNGTINISSPDSDVSGGLTELSTDFIDATAILNQGCATRAGSDVGRLVIAGRGGLPAGPDATLAASNSVRLSCN